MKIGIFTDVHANLPALKCSAERFRELKCDSIIHLGDLIGIGPYPKECLEYCAGVEEMQFVMGNHDYWYGYGLPNPISKWMSTDEVSHQQWTHNEIGESYKSTVRNWKFELRQSFDNKSTIIFQYYALNEKRNWFKSIIKEPTGHQLDELFNFTETDMIFYGHQHKSSDLIGKARYVNLGSKGCNNEPTARIGILENENNEFTLTKEALKYDDHKLMEEFELRKVPARAFIKKVFLPRD